MRPTRSSANCSDRSAWTASPTPSGGPASGVSSGTRDDPLATARGLANGVLLGIPLWAAIGGLGWCVVWLWGQS